MKDDRKWQFFMDMLRIRLVEEQIAQRYPDGKMRCPVHLSIGQEAVAVGVCSALEEGDEVFSGHRSHAHYLAKGGNLERMLAEIYGKEDGCSRGKGGSMHLTDLAAGFIGATPVVGSTIPIAVGAALAAAIRRELRVVVVFFGDGAAETGVFHESLAFAMLKRLPILFVCENNLYSVYSPMDVRQSPDRTIVQMAQGHGMAAERHDGNDVTRVFAATKRSVCRIREDGGPMLLEFSTYRFREHCGPLFDNDIGYRAPEEAEAWNERDPVKVMASRLEASGMGGARIAGLREQLLEEIGSAFQFAEGSKFPHAEEVATQVYA